MRALRVPWTGFPVLLDGGMRTRSKRARHCPVCHGPMKKSGRTTAGSQRWKCTACALSSTAVRRDRARDFQLREFLDWLLTGRIQEQMGPTGARAFRKRVGWCWNIAPAIEPDGVVHHTVMADGTCMAHGWCLIIAIDGASGQVIDWQWCHHENTAAYTALFGRIPRPDVLITDGLRGVERACAAVWPGTRIQRCLVHVQRNTRTDLTSRPRLQAGRELKKLSDRLTRVHDPEGAARRAGALHHQPFGGRAQLTHQTHPAATPRTARGTHETRLRMALLHERPQPRPHRPHQRHTPPTTTSTRTEERTGNGRARKLRHRHRLERTPHTRQIPRQHTLTTTTQKTASKAPRLVPKGPLPRTCGYMPGTPQSGSPAARRAQSRPHLQ